MKASGLLPGGKFHNDAKRKGIVYLEDSVMWYVIDWGIDYYLSLSIHQRINFKDSYFDLQRWERLFLK